MKLFIAFPYDYGELIEKIILFLKRELERVEKEDYTPQNTFCIEFERNHQLNNFMFHSNIHEGEFNKGGRENKNPTTANFTLNYHTDDFNSIDGEFDTIIMSAGAESLPKGLVEKLVIGGKLILPVGKDGSHQIKRIIRDSESSFIEDNIGMAKFVPLITAEQVTY